MAVRHHSRLLPGPAMKEEPQATPDPGWQRSRRQFLRLVAYAPLLPALPGAVASCSSSSPGPRRDTAAFVRLHDEDSKPYVPAGQLRNHWYPENVAQVRTIVLDAAKTNRHVRAAGSGWALSPAVCDAGWREDLIDTRALNRVRTDVLPTAMNRQVADALAAMEYRSGVDHDQCHTFVHVGAGMRIYELYSWLDGQTPSLGPTSKGKAWAMGTMGGAGGQSITGAFSTSTHGGDQHAAPLPDSVVAVEMVGPGGQLLWIQGEDVGGGIPLCDEERVRAALARQVIAPGSGSDGGTDVIGVITNDDALNSVRTAVGRFGVITSVVLQVIPQYGLARKRERTSWAEVRNRLTSVSSALFDSRYLRVMVNPYPAFDSEQHHVWIEQREMVPVPAETGETGWTGRKMRTGERAGRAGQASGAKGDFLATICSRNGVRESLLTIAERAEDGARKAVGAGLLVGLVFAPLLPPGVAGSGVIVSSELAVALELVAARAKQLAEQNTGSVGDLLADFANWMVEQGHGWALSLLVDAVVNSGQPELPQPDVDYSYAVMDMFDYADHACVTDGDSIEVAFDASGTAHVDFVERNIFTAAADLLARKEAVGVYVTLRFTSSTRALLGIERWTQSCIIEVAGLKRFKGLTTLLQRLQTEAIKAGGTVHWGQRNDMLTAPDVTRSYPELPRWRESLRQIGGGRPGDQFSTAFTRLVGLEP